MEPLVFFCSRSTNPFCRFWDALDEVDAAVSVHLSWFDSSSYKPHQRQDERSVFSLIETSRWTARIFKQLNRQSCFFAYFRPLQTVTMLQPNSKATYLAMFSCKLNKWFTPKRVWKYHTGNCAKHSTSEVYEFKMWITRPNQDNHATECN